jgi:hypothetical protein
MKFLKFLIADFRLLSELHRALRRQSAISNRTSAISANTKDHFNRELIEFLVAETTGRKRDTIDGCGEQRVLSRRRVF